VPVLFESGLMWSAAKRNARKAADEQQSCMSIHVWFLGLPLSEM